MSREGAFWVVPELLYTRRQFGNAVNTDPIKLMFQAYLGEFAEQCAKSWEPGKGDLLDRYGSSAVFLRTKSEKLSRKLNQMGLTQLANGDAVKGRMIIAASRTQSDSLQTRLVALMADASVKQPKLWEGLLRPMVRKIVARRAQAKAAAPPKPATAPTEQAPAP
jgi:hypothetical protein